MGLVIDYTLNFWALLGVYLDDGRIEIDQNVVRNVIRPTALSKNNWLFIGEAEAGQRSAVLYTINECCWAVRSILMPICATSSPACPTPPTGQIKEISPSVGAIDGIVTPGPGRVELRLAIVAYRKSTVKTEPRGTLTNLVT